MVPAITTPLQPIFPGLQAVHAVLRVLTRMPEPKPVTIHQTLLELTLPVFTMEVILILVIGSVTRLIMLTADGLTAALTRKPGVLVPSQHLSQSLPGLSQPVPILVLLPGEGPPVLPISPGQPSMPAVPLSGCNRAIVYFPLMLQAPRQLPGLPAPVILSSF